MPLSLFADGTPSRGALTAPSRWGAAARGASSASDAWLQREKGRGMAGGREGNEMVWQ